MPKLNRLPPKGLNEAASAAADVLREGRYTADPTPEPAPAPPAPAKPARPSTPRSDTEGMTRRSYYLQAADADDLDAAVKQIHAALHGLVPKHRILGAILRVGLDDLATVTKRLKEELLAGLD